MKRIFNIIIILIATIATSNAQFFVEGNIRILYNDLSNSSGTTNPAASWYSISVFPQVGYWLNDNISIGTRVFYRSSIRKNLIIDPDNPGHKIDRREPFWEFSVFCRYKLWGMEKFSILIDGSVFAGTGSIKYKSESTSRTIQTLTRIGINVHPAFSYKLTDKFCIKATCDFLGIDLYTQTIKFDNVNRKEKSNHFEFNTKSDIFSALGSIKIGFIYNF